MVDERRPINVLDCDKVNLTPVLGDSLLPGTSSWYILTPRTTPVSSLLIAN